MLRIGYECHCCQHGVYTQASSKTHMDSQAVKRRHRARCKWCTLESHMQTEWGESTNRLTIGIHLRLAFEGIDVSNATGNDTGGHTTLHSMDHSQKERVKPPNHHCTIPPPTLLTSGACSFVRLDTGVAQTGRPIHTHQQKGSAKLKNGSNLCVKRACTYPH